MTKERERPSQYLVNKCEAIETVINFFDGERDSKERLIAFLIQLDFWDWEVDNLIYSFEDFKKRAAAWENTNVEDMLRQRGILVERKKLDDVEFRRRCRKYSWNKKPKVVPPVENLNQVIGKWNDLLVRCEETMLSEKGIKHAASYGANVEPNLGRFKKQPVTL